MRVSLTPQIHFATQNVCVILHDQKDKPLTELMHDGSLSDSSDRIVGSVQFGI